MLTKITRTQRPSGFCADIGSPKCVIGRKECNRICTKFGIHERHIKPSNERFSFADHSYPSLGKVSIPPKTPIRAPKIIVVLDMVEADIPPLLGMDLLDREELCADTTVNHLAKRTKIECPDGRNIYIDEWVIPMTRADSGHSFVPMDFRPASQSYISHSEHGKLHRQLYHPSTDKLFNLLKVASPEDATPQTRKLLTDITNSCDPCHRIHNAPNRFRVSFGTEHIRFNENPHGHHVHQQ